MPVRLLLAIAFIVLCTVGVGFFLAEDNSGRFAWLTDPQPQPPPANNPSQSASVSTPGAQPPSPLPTEPSDDALGFMLASAAQQYAQNIRYPQYSLPLSAEQAKGYEGNRFDPIALPLSGDGRFTVTLEKFRFVEDEPILVAASITGRQVVSQRMSASLENAATRDTLESAELTSSADGFFQGQLNAAGDPGEYRLIVEARIDGETVRHVSTLTIEPDLGEFDGLGDPSIRNNDLVIPVHFNAEEPGFYALSAQLLDHGQPIALLNAEKRLEGSGSTIDLRAHGSVMAGKTVDGKLQVRHLQIRRLPAKPGDRTDYGFGPDEGYSFTPPDLEPLTDTPASDPESEQRAALLKQLADKF